MFKKVAVVDAYEGTPHKQKGELNNVSLDSQCKKKLSIEVKEYNEN